jgi:hypothetical protein
MKLDENKMLNNKTDEQIFNENLKKIFNREKIQILVCDKIFFE